MKRKIIIDTDPGHDDAMALMLAVQSGEFDIKAVTTVCGNSTIENTTRNARYVLDLLKKKELSIYSGASKPLKRKLIQAVVHGKSGLEGIDPTNDAFLTNDAVNKIIALIKKNPFEITLVTLGPLTNIASAILKNPSAMKKVKEIVSMGGAIKVSGNKNRVAEFNMFVDPEAAQIVMDFPVKKTFVPLDACNHVQMSLKDFMAIRNKILKTAILKMIRPYIRNIEKDTGINAALMYDPLTVFYLLSPTSCTVDGYSIQVETKGKFTRGMTVADFRVVKDNAIKNCNVVTSINEREFIKCFISALGINFQDRV